MNYETSSYHVYLESGESLDRPNRIFLIQQAYGREIASLYVDPSVSLFKREDNKLATHLLSKWILPQCIGTTFSFNSSVWQKSSRQDGYLIGTLSNRPTTNRKMMKTIIQHVKPNLSKMSNLYVSSVSPQKMDELQDSVCLTNQKTRKLVK